MTMGRYRHLATASLVALVWAGAARADPAALELGRKVFLELSQPQCAICHTLNDAGAAGQVGPSLDDLKPDAKRVAAAVTDGIGVMPPNEELTKEQVDAVSLYVAAVAGKAK